MSSLADLRREYASRALTEADALDDPIQQFSLWFGEALKAELLDTNAMTLATASRDGVPAASAVPTRGRSIRRHARVDRRLRSPVRRRPRARSRRR